MRLPKHTLRAVGGLLLAFLVTEEAMNDKPTALLNYQQNQSIQNIQRAKNRND